MYVELNPKTKSIYFDKENLTPERIKTILNTHRYKLIKLKNFDMYIPIYFNSNYGVCFNFYDRHILFSKVILVGEEEKLRLVSLSTFWLGEDYNVRLLETNRLALYGSV